MGFPFLQSTALLYDQFIVGQNQFINDQEDMIRKILIKRYLLRGYRQLKHSVQKR